jgi:hypothetical protein
LLCSSIPPVRAFGQDSPPSLDPAKIAAALDSGCASLKNDLGSLHRRAGELEKRLETEYRDKASVPDAAKARDLEAGVKKAEAEYRRQMAKACARAPRKLNKPANLIDNELMDYDDLIKDCASMGLPVNDPINVPEPYRQELVDDAVNGRPNTWQPYLAAAKKAQAEISRAKTSSKDHAAKIASSGRDRTDAQALGVSAEAFQSIDEESEVFYLSKLQEEVIRVNKVGEVLGRTRAPEATALMQRCNDCSVTLQLEWRSVDEALAGMSKTYGFKRKRDAPGYQEQLADRQRQLELALTRQVDDQAGGRIDSLLAKGTMGLGSAATEPGSALSVPAGKDGTQAGKDGVYGAGGTSPKFRHLPGQVPGVGTGKDKDGAEEGRPGGEPSGFSFALDAAIGALSPKTAAPLLREDMAVLARADTRDWMSARQAEIRAQIAGMKEQSGDAYWALEKEARSIEDALSSWKKLARDPYALPSSLAAWQAGAEKVMDGSGTAKEEEALRAKVAERQAQLRAQFKEKGTDEEKAAFAEQAAKDPELMKALASLMGHLEDNPAYAKARMSAAQAVDWNLANAGLLPDGAAFSPSELGNLGMKPEAFAKDSPVRIATQGSGETAARGYSFKGPDGLTHFRSFDDSVRVDQALGPDKRTRSLETRVDKDGLKVTETDEATGRLLGVQTTSRSGVTYVSYEYRSRWNPTRPAEDNERDPARRTVASRTELPDGTVVETRYVYPNGQASEQYAMELTRTPDGRTTFVQTALKYDRDLGRYSDGFPRKSGVIVDRRPVVDRIEEYYVSSLDNKPVSYVETREADGLVWLHTPKDGNTSWRKVAWDQFPQDPSERRKALGKAASALTRGDDLARGPVLLLLESIDKEKADATEFTAYYDAADKGYLSFTAKYQKDEFYQEERGRLETLTGAEAVPGLTKTYSIPITIKLKSGVELTPFRYVGPDRVDIWTKDFATGNWFTGYDVTEITKTGRHRIVNGQWIFERQVGEAKERVIHSGVGIVGATGGAIANVGRTAVQLTGSAVALTGAMTYGMFDGERQRDLLDRAYSNFMLNDVSTQLNTLYGGPDADQTVRLTGANPMKNVMNVGAELDSMGHPTVGAVLQGGVDFAATMPTTLAMGPAMGWLANSSRVAGYGVKAYSVYGTVQSAYDTGAATLILIDAAGSDDPRVFHAALRNFTTTTLSNVSLVTVYKDFWPGARGRPAEPGAMTKAFTRDISGGRDPGLSMPKALEGPAATLKRIDGRIADAAEGAAAGVARFVKDPKGTAAAWHEARSRRTLERVEDLLTAKDFNKAYSQLRKVDPADPSLPPEVKAKALELRKLMETGVGEAYGDRLQAARAGIGETQDALIARLVKQDSRTPGSVVGQFHNEGVPTQSISDCVVKQMYHHPNMRHVRDSMTYEQFREVVSQKTGTDFTKTGLGEAPQTEVLKMLGMEKTPRRPPASEAELLLQIHNNGALEGTVKAPSLADYTGEAPFYHAVVVLGAAKNPRTGQWEYVVQDSNFKTPQTYSYAELQRLDIHTGQIRVQTVTDPKTGQQVPLPPQSLSTRASMANKNYGEAPGSPELPAKLKAAEGALADFDNYAAREVQRFEAGYRAQRLPDGKPAFSEGDIKTMLATDAVDLKVQLQFRIAELKTKISGGAQTAPPADGAPADVKALGDTAPGGKIFDPPMTGRKDAVRADAWADDPVVKADVEAFHQALTTGKGLRQGQAIQPEAGEFYRGVGVKELKRIVDQGGAVPYIYQPEFRNSTRSNPVTLRQAIDADGNAVLAMNDHSNGNTVRFTGVTKSVKVAEVNTGNGAVLRIRTERAYPNRISKFNEGPMPEQELLIPGVVKAADIEIRGKDGIFYPLASPEGRATLQDLGVK